MKKIMIYSILILLAATVVAGCGKEKAGKAKEEAIPVKVIKVRLENLNRVVEHVGNIIGINEVLVYPKVSGKIIEKVKEDGAAVTKGEAIAYIDRDEVGLKFEKAPVESPLTGTVGRVYVDIGAYVMTSTPVALVSDMARAQINMDIPEVYLPKISLGQEAEVKVDAYPNTTFMGKVVKISPVVDIETRTAPIEIDIDNNENLLQSGMFAKADLILEERENVPVILKEAIMGKEPNQYVYIVEGDVARLRDIKLGIRQGPYYEVAEGVKEGDLVVIMGQQRLRDGSIVAAEE